MPLPNERFKVFISHATAEDGDLVCWMAEALDRLHVRAYVYEAYQIGGQNRFEEIKAMIKACPYFLVVLTEAGIASQWVNQEIGYAVGVSRTPIPIVEVDYSGRRLESRGFVELHDPIDYRRDDSVGMMALVVYTFCTLLTNARQWKDRIFLSCDCGHDFDEQLDFEKHWSMWQKGPDTSPFDLEWDCPDCKRVMKVSFPDCHLLPQEG